MPKTLLKAREVAKVTGFTKSTTRQMGLRGEIPGAVVIGRHVLFDPDRFLEFLARGSREPRFTASTGDLR